MTTDDNVIQMPEPIDKIGKRASNGYCRAQLGLMRGKAAKAQMAVDFMEARARFQTTTDFLAWVDRENFRKALDRLDKANLRILLRGK